MSGATPVAISYEYDEDYDAIYGGEWEEDWDMEDWDEEDEDDEYDFSMIEDWTGEELSEDEQEQLTAIVDGV